MGVEWDSFDYLPLVFFELLLDLEEVFVVDNWKSYD